MRRVAPGYANLFLCGPIQPGVIIAPIEPGFNLVGTLKSSDRLTLDSLNLYTGDPKTGVASGLNLTASDDLFVVQPNGVTGAFFYFNDSRGQTGWRDSLYNPAGSTLISPGSAFIIKRQPANGSFNWTIPAE